MHLLDAAPPTLVAVFVCCVIVFVCVNTYLERERERGADSVFVCWFRETCCA